MTHLFGGQGRCKSVVAAAQTFGRIELSSMTDVACNASSLNGVLHSQPCCGDVLQRGVAHRYSYHLSKPQGGKDWKAWYWCGRPAHSPWAEAEIRASADPCMHVHV